MKTLIAATLLCLGMVGAAAADPALGMWQTQPDDGAYAHINMTPCGAAVCGTIARTFNASGEYQSPNLGKQIVINMQPDRQWSQIYTRALFSRAWIQRHRRQRRPSQG